MYISCIGEGSYLYLATHSNKPRVLSVVASDPSGIELNTTQPQKRIIIRKRKEKEEKKIEKKYKVGCYYWLVEEYLESDRATDQEIPLDVAVGCAAPHINGECLCCSLFD